MPWLMLLAGLALWAAAHLFKRLAPEKRAALGDPGRGLVAVLIILSLVLMIYGYRWAPFVPIWSPPAFFIHINNLLMLVALYVYLSAMAASHLKVARLKHPQLAGFKIWALAHLLVNGDLASVLLFGGLLAWGVVSLIIINKADGPTLRSERAPLKAEWQMALVGLVAFGVVALLHNWAGKWPFPG